jgi:hypothetical protein
MRTGGVEPPQHEATRLQRAELAGAQRPRERAADRDRTGTAGITTPGAAGYTTAATSDVGEPMVPHRPSPSGCAPVIGVWPPGRQSRPPASSACAWFTDRGLACRRRATTMCAWRTSGSHVDSAGGIRTHDLELMRLAGTAAPLPRIASLAASAPARRSRAPPAARPADGAVPSGPVLKYCALRPDTVSRTPGKRTIWLAGVEPAISGAQSRRGGQSPLQPDVHGVDDRGIEPRCTAVSERRLPSRPVVESRREESNPRPPR